MIPNKTQAYGNCHPCFEPVSQTRWQRDGHPHPQAIGVSESFADDPNPGSGITLPSDRPVPINARKPADTEEPGD